VVSPFVDGLVRDGVVTRWFFIRYSDPHWHIRLRLKGDPAALSGDVLPALSELIEREVARGRVWKLELDTYEREVARYGGGRAIDLAEALFHSDSDAAVALLRAAPGDAGMDARWKIALAGIDRLFEDFGLSLESKRALARRQRDGYAAEFGAGTHLKKGIGGRYRDVKDELTAILRGHPGGDPVVGRGLEILGERTRTGAPVVAQIRDLDVAGALSVTIDELAATLAHVWVNRALRSAHRAQEYVIYDLLDRLYAAEAARAAGAPGHA
jgi:thiopeptide-type bacteriocin biosynthesis protein